MRGGLVGSFCFLAFLLSASTKGQNVLNSQDLQGTDHEDHEQQAIAETRAVSDETSSIEDDDQEKSRANAVDSRSSVGNEAFNGIPNWSVPSNLPSGWANTLLNTDGNGPGLDYRYPDPNYANAEAAANAQALLNAGGNNPGFGYGYPGLDAANAQALANAHALGNAGGNKPGFGYGYPGLDAANAQASANAQAFGNVGGNIQGLGNIPSNQHSLNSAYADAKALASTGGGSPYGWKSGTEDEIEPESVEAKQSEIDVESDHLPDFEVASRMGGMFNDYGNHGAFSGALSRVVPKEEYIYPDLIPGGQNAVTCSRESELHTIWSPIYQCLVCVCVREGWTLRAACVTCNTCKTKPAPRPAPTIVIPPPPPPPLIPESQVSCSPLPTNMPFDNPMNPCQTCICKKIINVFGQEDIQIKCEENPSCVTPPEFVPIPPLAPQPVPMPLCESLPANVPFPHPTKTCTICRCVVEMSPYLIPERRMICQPDPDCAPPMPVPTPPTFPTNTEFPLIPFPPPTPPPTPQPMPTPHPIIPELRPTELDPIPWPPIVPQLPSPLPGPPPHETCKPYPPNTPFQHPWDECQICVCSEIYGTHVVNIEVNCFTKKSCCIEPPIPEPRPLPYKPIPQPRPSDLIVSPYSNLIFIEPKCRYRAPHSPYVVDCSICSCETVYQYVYAKCIPQPNCDLIPGSSANAAASAIAQVNQIASQAAAEANAQAQNALAQASAIGFSSADAFSNANAIASSGNQYPYIGGSPSSSYSSADALANAQTGNLNFSPYSNSYSFSPIGQSSAQAQAEAISNAQSGLSSSYPYSLGGQSSAQAQAEAIANAQSGLSNSYPYSLGGQSSAQAQAEAIANAQSGLSSSYPYSLGGQSSAQAQSEALAESGLNNQYPYSLGGQSSAQAQAEALANAQSSLIPPYGSYPYSSGGQSSAQAQAEAFAQSSNLSPYNLYGHGAQSSAQAQAEALAQSGGLYPYGYPFSPGQSQSTAQAEALAQTFGSSPYGGNPYSIGQSSAQAQAEAQSQLGSQNGGYQFLGGAGVNQASAQAQAEAIAASQLYPSLYPYPTMIVEPLYQPSINGWDGTAQSQAMASAQAQAQAAQAQAEAQAFSFGGSSANAQSQAIAQGGDATAQSLAQTAALSGRPLIKSGKGLCKYAGDKYHHNCQACYCFGELSGKIYTLCLGNPCS